MRSQKQQEIKGGVAVIEKDDKHFLIKQSKNKPLAGKWRHPGGSFNEGETFLEGIKREVKEETGLEVEVIGDKPLHLEQSDYLPGYFGFYKAVIKEGVLEIDNYEIDDYGWFTLEEISKLDLMKGTKEFYRKQYKL